MDTKNSKNHPLYGNLKQAFRDYGLGTEQAEAYIALVDQHPAISGCSDGFSTDDLEALKFHLSCQTGDDSWNTVPIRVMRSYVIALRKSRRVRVA